MKLRQASVLLTSKIVEFLTKIGQSVAVTCHYNDGYEEDSGTKVLVAAERSEAALGSSGKPLCSVDVAP